MTGSLRLKLRDLAAGAAFASMAVSGALPVWATVGFALGLFLALLDVRVLRQYSNATAALLGVGALLLVASVASGTTDLVIAASTFAALIAICRVLATPEPKADGQVLLTSFLMVAGGAALSADVLFALALAAFAALAMLSVGLSVIERFAEAGEPLPRGPAIRQLAVGAAFALLGSILLFAGLPRFSWNLALRRGPFRGQAASGFSDGVSLSASGRIKVNPTIVARVKRYPDPESQALQAYWLGRTFDTFDGIAWQAQRAPRRTWGKVKASSAQGPFVHQSIELLPAYGSRTLVALEWPALFSRAFARTAESSRPALFIELRGQEIRIDEAAASYTYEVDSVEQVAGMTVLAAPGNPADYLQLPAALDERIQALARSAAGDTREAIQAAHNVERFLRTNYGYTLDLPGVAGDPLADFLFTRKSGHCEQFATALTVMLRTLGIPARLATGFFGGERVGDHYVIRAGDAHAWTQLILPDSRLISLDATPELSRAAQSAGALEWLVRAYETLGERWRSSVVDYSLQDQAELATRMKEIPRPSLPWQSTALAGLLLALLIWRRVSARRAALHEATAMLEAAEHILARAGVARRSSECIEEVSHRLTLARHPLSVALADITRRYLHARFGRRPLRPRESARLIGTLAALERSIRRARARSPAASATNRSS